jgi:hypothetical protein
MTLGGHVTRTGRREWKVSVVKPKGNGKYMAIGEKYLQK